MNKEQFRLGAYVVLILRKGDDILLIRRFNTGAGDGLYSCAGGRVDGNEPVTQAVIREAAEELGIKLKKEDLKVVHIVHAKLPLNLDEWVGFFIEATCWDGEPKNMEPHKHDDIGWFPLSDLPSNTMPTLLHVLEMLKKDLFFSEFGWE